MRPRSPSTRPTRATCLPALTTGTTTTASLTTSASTAARPGPRRCQTDSFRGSPATPTTPPCRARGVLAGRRTHILDAAADHPGANPEQPGRPDRDRAGRCAVPDVRQRHPGREGHGELRVGVEGRGGNVERTDPVLYVQQSGVSLSAVLLQHFG